MREEAGRTKARCATSTLRVQPCEGREPRPPSSCEAKQTSKRGLLKIKVAKRLINAAEHRENYDTMEFLPVSPAFSLK